MRRKIIKLLKKLEFREHYKNEYHDCVDSYEPDYLVTEVLHFPNYYFIIDELKKNNDVSSNYIMSELKRMELEGILFVDIQEMHYQALNLLGNGPDYDDLKKKTESIILTTKGKNRLVYYWYKLLENPFVAVIALVSLVVSITQVFFRLNI